MNMLLHSHRSFTFSVAIGLLATLAAMSIGCTQRPNQQAVEDEYDFKYQKVTAEIADLSNELARKQRVLGSDIVGGGSSEEDRQKLLELQKEQTRLLDELIAINPENDDYRFESAKLASANGDRKKAIDIINELAPEDVPGYPMAHMVLAKQYFEKTATSRIQKMGDLDIALKHVDHVLTRDRTNLEAKLLKARILTQSERFEEAYQLYEDLFEVNPNYYRELAALNQKLSREERNRPLYEKALAGFQVLADKEENRTDDKRWIVIETGIAKTLQKLDRFEEAESRHQEMIASYSRDPNGGPRRVFLQRLLSDTYVVWAGKIAGSNASFTSLPTETLAKMVDLYTKAYANHQENTLVMQALARLSLSPNAEIAAQAKAIYDPKADIDAPSAVLNQLGNHALQSKEFSEAIRYYERAREKSPEDPAVLNNLSFSYLVSEGDERNAARALQLINEAIRLLTKNIGEPEKAKFLHTKATALKQLDRLEEAIAVYETSLKARPSHEDTLRSLFVCYRGLNMNPPEPYILDLQKVEAQKK